jgi:hypothetical protein
VLPGSPADFGQLFTEETEGKLITTAKGTKVAKFAGLKPESGRPRPNINSAPIRESNNHHLNHRARRPSRPRNRPQPRSVPEGILLFCLASDTDWQAASITHATTQHMMVRGLIERQAATRYVLTEQGRAVLATFLER